MKFKLIEQEMAVWKAICINDGIGTVEIVRTRRYNVKNVT